MDSKKRIHWDDFFIYLIVTFPIFLVLIWFMSFTFSGYDIELPVLPIAAVISIGACLVGAYKDDEQYAAEQENARLASLHANAKPKKKSVVGSAVIGSIIAGPVGGVVGAIHAADKNAQNRASDD